MTTFDDLPNLSHADLMRSKALTESIRQEIATHHGQISFARFMELALYHPENGYYNAPDIDLGAQGDFTTAPEISPLFAQCFARQCQQIFPQLGTKNILEFGAGTGKFASDLLLALDKNHDVAHYFIYEISMTLREKQRIFLQKTCPHLLNRVTWLEQLPSDFIGIMIANEVLDALPADCFCIENNEVKERVVAWENEKFVWKISTPDTENFKKSVEKIHHEYDLDNGYESEINLNLPKFIDFTTHCLSRGIVLFADYGYGQREYYHPERRHGTLTCFYRHRRHSNPLIYPGLQDITTHVDFTHLVESAVENGFALAGYTSQSAFLLSCGLMDMAAKAEKNLSPKDEFKLHQAIKLLTLPSEMGEVIKVMALTKNIELALMGFTLQDRRRDL